MVYRRALRRWLIVARRQRCDVLGRRIVSGPSWALLLSSQSRATSVALHVHLEDRGVMDEAIDGCQGHGRILEDLSPFAEGLIGRDQERAALVASADQLEQHGGFRLVLGHVHQIVQDQ